MAAGFRLSRLSARGVRLCGVRPRLPLDSRLARCLSGGASREQFLYSKPGLKAKIIDGKKIAQAVKSEVADEVK